MRWFLTLTLPLFLIDFLTKEWTVRRFPTQTDHIDDITVIPEFFWLVRVHNQGVAFGLGNGHGNANLIFGGICLAALLVICVAAYRGTFRARIEKTAAALLVSGILGNLLDRCTRGYVVDFLLFDLKFMMWPAFNVADACICIAAFLLFISAFRKEQPSTKTTQPPPSES